jgi:ABC-type amino acid transport substrate-binding protein
MKKRISIILCFALCAALALTACGGGGDGGSVPADSGSAAVVDSGSASDSGSSNAAAPVAITSPEDFPGHSVAVQTGTTAADSIDEMIAGGADIEVFKYESIMQCFDEVKLGRVDAVYVDSVVGAYYTTGTMEFNRVWINDVGEPMGVCLAKSSDKLTAAIEAAIDTMFYDGTMAEIAEKHFGDDLTAGLRNVTEAPVIPTDFTTGTSGKLMVGMEMTYPPMEYMMDDGVTPIGFDIDVAARIAELLGLEVEYVSTAFDSIFPALDKGEFDCAISAVSITPDRQENYIMTEAYVSNALCIVVSTGAV